MFSGKTDRTVGLAEVPLATVSAPLTVFCFRWVFIKIKLNILNFLKWCLSILFSNMHYIEGNLG